MSGIYVCHVQDYEMMIDVEYKYACQNGTFLRIDLSAVIQRLEYMNKSIMTASPKNSWH